MKSIRTHRVALCMLFLTSIASAAVYEDEYYQASHGPVLYVTVTGGGKTKSYEPNMVHSISESEWVYTDDYGDTWILRQVYESTYDTAPAPQFLYAPLSDEGDVTVDVSARSTPPYHQYGRDESSRFYDPPYFGNYGGLWYEQKSINIGVSHEYLASMSYAVSMPQPYPYEDGWTVDDLNAHNANSYTSVPSMLVKFYRCMADHWWYGYGPPHNTEGARTEPHTVPCSRNYGWSHGFDFDPDPDVPGDNSAIASGIAISNMDLLRIYIPGQRYSLSLDYPASDPGGVVVRDGTPRLPDSGNIRLWLMSIPSVSFNGITGRRKASIHDGGDYVPPGTYTHDGAPWYYGSDGIGGDGGHVLYLHMEGVKPGPATFTIHVTSMWTDNLGREQSITTSDAVTVMVQPVTDPGPICTPCQCVDGKFSREAADVDTGLRTVSHEADDFGYPTATDSCVSCTGASSGGLYARPSLRMRRVHRYDLQDWPSSFGPGVFNGYDIRWRMLRNGSSEFWDPSMAQPLVLSASGMYMYDWRQGAIRSMAFFDANGSLTYANWNAATAEVYRLDGSRIVMEMMQALPSDARALLYARPVRIENPQGQAIVLSYLHPRDADPVTLGDGWPALWKLNSITDAYGLRADMAYGPVIGGMSCVSSITYGGSKSASYGYREDGALPGLAHVQHVDGSSTTITAGSIGDGRQMSISFQDSMADGTRGSARLVLDRPHQGNPVPWRVSSVFTGGDELAYRGLPTGDDQGNNVTLVQQGDRIYRHVTVAGVPVGSDYLSSGSWDNALITGVWAPGKRYQFAWKNRMQYEENALGQRIAMQHDAVFGHPLRYDYPDGSYETWTYDGSGNLLEHRDRINRRTTATWNDRRQKLSETTPDGHTRSWTYDPVTGDLLTATDARGAVTTYAYDAKGRLESVSEPGNTTDDPPSVRTFGYDALNRLEWSKDAYGNATSYAYDHRGRRTLVTYPDASYEEDVYGVGPDAGRVVMRRTRNGHWTDFDYDAAGRLRSQFVRVIHGDGRVEAVGDVISYIPGTSLESMRSRRGETVVVQRDALRRITAETAYASRTRSLTTTYDHDAAGRRIRATDAYGRRTLTVFDVNDRPVRVVREAVPGAVPGGAVLADLPRLPGANPVYVIEDMAYDAAGQMVTRTDGRGIVSAYTYDGNGRVLTRSDADAVTRFSYDENGNTTSITTPRGVETQISYTRSNQPWVTTEALGTDDEQVVSVATYTASRKLLTMTDALGHTTIYRYGGCCDRLDEVEDPLGYITSFGYDYVGNRTRITDPNQLSTVTTYDALDRPVTIRNAANETMSYAYDDNLIDGVGLDALYAVHMAGLDFGRDPETGYGADGSAVAMSNASGQTTLDIRDGLGRVVRRIDERGMATTIIYDTVVEDVHGGEDAQTLVATVVRNAMQHTTSRWADGLGRIRVLVDADQAKSRQGWDAVGNQISQRDANGVGWDAVFNARGFLVSQSDTRTGAPVTTTWDYDADGNRIAETITIDGVPKTETYGFDLRNRRRSILDRLGGLTQFAYDAVGNLTRITDAEGGITSYVYDARNLLTSETFPGPTGGTRTYSYDPGRRLLTRTQQGAAAAGGN